MDLCRFRGVALWMRNFADEFIPNLWNERLRRAYPVLALSIETRRRGAGKAELLADQELDPRKAYIREVIAEFEADPESINPFDSVAVLLLYQHYRDLVNAGSMYLSVHNFGVLVALHLNIRHGIFRSGQSDADLDAIIGARFVDKTGKLKKHLDRQWQALVVDRDTLIVSQELKRFILHMRREYFLKLQYVMFVSSLPYFPHSMFEGKLVLAGKKKTKDVLVCVTREAVLILDDKTNQTTDQYYFPRMLSWAFSKEVFSFRYVSERGASRRGAEEVIVISPEAQILSDAVNKSVGDLVLLETPLAAATADSKSKLPKLLDEYLQHSLSLAKLKSKDDPSQEKKLRQISQHCGAMAEMCRTRIAAARTKKNVDEIADWKKRTMSFLLAASKLDAALRLAGRGTLDVTTTVRLTSAVKNFGHAVETMTGEEDLVLRSKLEEVIKRAEEMN